MGSRPVTSRISLPKKAGPRVAIGQPLPENATERDLEDLVLLHLAFLPWCRFWRNKERHTALPDGRTDYTPGLAKGSADLIGVVRRGDTVPGVGVFCAIELKRPLANMKPRDDQLDWLGLARRMGGVVGWTDSLYGALEIVANARGIALPWLIAELETKAGPLA